MPAEPDELSVHQLGVFDADAACHRLDLDTTLTPVVVVSVGPCDRIAPLAEPLDTPAKAHPAAANTWRRCC